MKVIFYLLTSSLFANSRRKQNGFVKQIVLQLSRKHRGSQPFQAPGPINNQTKGAWPPNCATSPMRKLSPLYKAEIKTTKII